MKNGEVIDAMIAYSDGNIHDIEHFLKVYAYAKAIGEEEGLDAETQITLETAAIVHDIGIPRARIVYQSTAGRYQEELGPSEAREMLEKLNCDPERIDRVCFLVGHHHTYDRIDGKDYRILLEADFLVNASEQKLSKAAITAAKRNFFRTPAALRFLELIFGV